MNKCPACGNTQEAQGVCEKCGAQTEAEASEAAPAAPEAPAGDSGAGSSEGGAAM